MTAKSACRSWMFPCIRSPSSILSWQNVRVFQTEQWSVYIMILVKRLLPACQRYVFVTFLQNNWNHIGKHRKFLRFLFLDWLKTEDFSEELYCNQGRNVSWRRRWNKGIIALVPKNLMMGCFWSSFCHSSKKKTNKTSFNWPSSHEAFDWSCVWRIY